MNVIKDKKMDTIIKLNFIFKLDNKGRPASH